MKLNRKWLMVIALVMSLTMATAGTLAYLTDNDSATNTFTIGDVDIELEEPSWDPEDEPTLLPGVEIEKDPQIRNAGNTEAWVWMEIVIPAELYDIIELDYSTNGWTKGAVTTNEDGDKVVLMKYDSKLAAGATTTPPAFTTVSIPTSVTELPEGMETADIVVNAYAIQAEKIGSIEDAIKAYNGEEITPDEPDEPANGDDDSVTYEIPANATRVTSSDELVSAINNGKTDIVLAEGEYNWGGTAKQGSNPLYELNLYGESKKAILYMTKEGVEGADYDFDGYDVTFTGLTISNDKYTSTGNYYPGWARMEATYNDCVIDGMYVLYDESEFNYCTLNVTGDTYNIWTWGAGKAAFDHCTFNSDGKSILVYASSCDLTISNCEFNDSDALAPVKAAIETGSDNLTAIYHNINVSNTTVNGFAVNTTNCDKVTTTLWANKNGMDQDHLNVIVDGVDVY